MKIAVWETGHEIADTIADSILAGLKADVQQTQDSHLASEYDLNIGYGILRGMDKVAKCGRPFIHLDRGYINPGHYDGYYRVSFNCTQQTSFDTILPDYERLNELGWEVSAWRGRDATKPVLVVPPTQPVSEFFGITQWPQELPKHHIIRRKGDTAPLNFNDYDYVLTFNSSLGWQAIAAGIPCISGPQSFVGNFRGGRREMFATMAALQLTLTEIRDGKLWQLINQLWTNQQIHSAFLSDGTTVKQSALT